jgi:cation-transporting ATPase 13A3/4/5
MHVQVINIGMFTLPVPGNFDSLLMEYTLTGYRVIALAYKNLAPKFNWKQAQRIDRDQVA